MVRPRMRLGRRGILAERLRAARAARGLTQESAALELGIARAALARYESGAQRPAGLARKYLDLWAAASVGEPVRILPEEHDR